MDDNGGDLNTYPPEYVGMHILAYGIIGEHYDISPEVYDAHKAYEIDKTKMKMLVPLDMNNKQLLNHKLYSTVLLYCVFSSGNGMLNLPTGVSKYIPQMETKHLIKQGYILDKILIQPLRSVDLGRRNLSISNSSFSTIFVHLRTSTPNEVQLNHTLGNNAKIKLLKNGSLPFQVPCVLILKIPIEQI